MNVPTRAPVSSNPPQFYSCPAPLWHLSLQTPCRRCRGFSLTAGVMVFVDGRHHAYIYFSMFVNRQWRTSFC